MAALLMAACLAGILAVSVAPAFAARTLEVHGATFTSQSIIRSIVGLDGTPNVFRIQTDRAAEEIARLPAVQSVTVHVDLPSTVVVNIVERDPKLVWVIGDRRYVVDQDGLLFGLVDSAGNPIPSSAGPIATPTEGAASSASASATTSASMTPPPASTPKPSPSPTRKPTPTPKKGAPATPAKSGAKASPSAAASAGSPTPPPNAALVPSLAPAPTADPAATSRPGALGLPVVFDRRASDAGLGLGGIIDPINLDAGYRLAGLMPADVGSTASALAVILDDGHGFTVSSVPTGWVAQFGFYTPTVRKVTVIPAQVRDLRSILGYAGEAKVAWVFLVSDVSADHSDTYLPR
ncbi:MAG TPA: FtsQ-type POTRA domain-containing protein [Candidatus Limnocylindrales bacterium]